MTNNTFKMLGYIQFLFRVLFKDYNPFELALTDH